MTRRIPSPWTSTDPPALWAAWWALGLIVLVIALAGWAFTQCDL